MSATPSPLVLQALLHASEVTGVPFDVLSAVAYVESRYNPESVGTSGEQGIMQLMPSVRKQFGVTNGFDPVQSALAGAQLLKRHIAKYGNWSQSFAAYNWGPANVDRKPDAAQWPAMVQRYVAGVFAKANLGPVPFGQTIEVVRHPVSPSQHRAAQETLERWRRRGLQHG